MSNKLQDCLSSNTLTEYPNDRILVLNSAGTVNSEQHVKVKIKGECSVIEQVGVCCINVEIEQANSQRPRKGGV